MNKFKEARLSAGLSQTQASKQTGVSLRCIQAWEQGVNKPTKFVEGAYLRALKVG